MRQVIKHRDIRLLNMIRRTDPVIPFNRMKLLAVLIPSAHGACPDLQERRYAGTQVHLHNWGGNERKVDIGGGVNYIIYKYIYYI